MSGRVASSETEKFGRKFFVKRENWTGLLAEAFAAVKRSKVERLAERETWATA
jgi:hypothetical protein